MNLISFFSLSRISKIEKVNLSTVTCSYISANLYNVNVLIHYKKGCSPLDYNLIVVKIQYINLLISVTIVCIITMSMICIF